ncbi:MAG: class I SAM-dependent methyltransferase [Symploca sp. SIO2G7]|nr:class I SAM-dependent methyltransferase [Symploca sp. SIO2G7]
MSAMKVELGPTQTTLLIPLLARAEQTQKTSGLINDPRAVEIVNQLDYDFSDWAGARSLAAAVLRTRMYDDDVLDFLAEYPAGTVVEIGCGLNTRFERLDNGQLTWFDLDLPDTIALRKQFFKDTPRRKMIAASVLDTEWFEQVKATGGPWCFISEAVIIYLDNAEAERSIAHIAQEFPGAWLITDTTAKAMVDTQDKHDLMKHLPKESWFRWACDEPEALEKLGLKLERSRTFMDASPDLIAQMPWIMRFIMRWMPWLIRPKLEGYRINRLIAKGL